MLEPGYRLDRYELLCPIAQGGMASVWLARLHGKHGFEKLVAVKTILPQFAQDLQFQRMFLDEARIASGIEHPNVAQILDLGEQHEVLYLVMEWVDGDSISRLFRAVERRGERMPVGILSRLIADTCAGLHAAHELTAKDGRLLGVVHRDISPQNVLVSVKGVAKLIDFGIAKARDRVAGETNAGNLKGKILYMAPEQALGQPVDRRADVWAIGAVMYHLLSGAPPYEGENQLATLHLLASPRPPAPLPPHVPRAIADVVMAALVHDVDDRIPTAAEAQWRLEHAIAASGLTTTTQDVTAFVRDYLGDRAEARRQAVELALEAAADRARLHSMLQPATSDSSSGVKPNPRALSGPGFPPLQQTQRMEPISTATLGSAAVVTPAQPIEVLAARRKRVALVGAVVGACSALLGVAVVIAFTRGGSEPKQQATTAHAPAPPPPQITVQTAASIPPPPPEDSATLPVIKPAPSASTAPQPPKQKPAATTTVKHPPKPVEPNYGF
jgi:serine/threonine-protein kinase